MAKTAQEIAAEIKALTKDPVEWDSLLLAKKLQPLLAGMLDVIQSLESDGITFGGLLTEQSVTIDTTIHNKFYLSVMYNSINDGEYETPGEGILTAVIVDENGEITLQSARMEGYNNVEPDVFTPVTSDAVYWALKNFTIPGVPNLGAITGVTKINYQLAMEIARAGAVILRYESQDYFMPRVQFDGYDSGLGGAFFQIASQMFDGHYNALETYVFGIQYADDIGDTISAKFFAITKGVDGKWYQAAYEKD